MLLIFTRGANKTFARPERKQAQKHVRDERDFNNIETRAVIKFFSPARQGAEGNSRHSNRNISFFPSWLGSGLISTPVFIGKFAVRLDLYLLIYLLDNSAHKGQHCNQVTKCPNVQDSGAFVLFLTIHCSSRVIIRIIKNYKCHVPHATTIHLQTLTALFAFLYRR